MPRKREREREIREEISRYDGDGNEIVKTIGLPKQNIKTARSPYFLDYDVKFPNCTNHDIRRHKTNCFLLLTQSFGVPSLENNCYWKKLTLSVRIQD